MDMQLLHEAFLTACKRGDRDSIDDFIQGIEAMGDPADQFTELAGLYATMIPDPSSGPARNDEEDYCLSEAEQKLVGAMQGKARECCFVLMAGGKYKKPALIADFCYAGQYLLPQEEIRHIAALVETRRQDNKILPFPGLQQA